MLNSIGATQFDSVAPWHGEKIPSYKLHQLRAELSSDNWTAAFFVDNLFDEYYFTSTRETQRYLEPYRMFSQAQFNDPGFLLRWYGRYVGRPRTVGFSMTYDF